MHHIAYVYAYELLLKLQRILCTRNGSNTVYQLPVTKQNRFLPITIGEQQGLTYDHPNGFTYLQLGRDFINLFLFKYMAF